ncbi:hypothetical protein RIF29_17391 [Crotalaria pallida]|uniref:Uncharacterized protein n=1 Tax=Crotalaria pallida TaxID=3830 RepID=A0AAN9FNX7_CROPI
MAARLSRNKYVVRFGYDTCALQSFRSFCNAMMMTPFLLPGVARSDDSNVNNEVTMIMRRFLPVDELNKKSSLSPVMNLGEYIDEQITHYGKHHL